jgi:peptidoglycan/xylan/chitin deacetylase (PgdA/CDA1 family)
MTENLISRRKTLGMIGMGAAAFLLKRPAFSSESPRHIITLSFDDGFGLSSIKTAEIFSKYGLHACINVIATAHLKNFNLPNEYHKGRVGDFSLWNELRSKGHEIMPHGLIHEDYAKLPLEDSKKSVLECLDIFSKELAGFNPEKAIFNFPYNSSTPEIEEWLNKTVRAYRTGGPMINAFPSRGQKKLTCISRGPENIDKYLESVIDGFLAGPNGWMIFNTHGLDDEGWGPLSSSFLDELLDKLSDIRSVELLTVTEALDTIN